MRYADRKIREFWELGHFGGGEKRNSCLEGTRWWRQASVSVSVAVTTINIHLFATNDYLVIL